jgi:hypothetical protein
VFPDEIEHLMALERLIRAWLRCRWRTRANRSSAADGQNPTQTRTRRGSELQGAGTSGAIIRGRNSDYAALVTLVGAIRPKRQ